jgi:hypothetical protein
LSFILGCDFVKRTWEYKTNAVEIKFDITESLSGRGYDAIGTHFFEGKSTPIAVRWGMGNFGFYSPGNYSDTLLDARYGLEGQTTVTVLNSKLGGISVGDVLKFELSNDSG